MKTAIQITIALLLIAAASANAQVTSTQQSTGFQAEIKQPANTTTTNHQEVMQGFVKESDAYNETKRQQAAETARMQQMQTNINQGANQGQQSQSGGAGANAAAGAALMAAGAAMMANPPTQPMGAMLMAMGLLAMAQSGEDSGAANQSGNTAAHSVLGNSAIATPDPKKGTAAYDEKAVKDAKAKLADAGYKMDGTNLVHPDGKVTPSSAFNSASSMAAAGMTPEAIAAAQEALSKVNAGVIDGTPRLSNVGVNSGGSGGSFGGGVTEGDSHGNSGMGGLIGTNPFALDKSRQNALVAGKTINFDGDPIGVRGQNIFDMVHTAYQRKRDNSHFIESDGEAVVSTRAPASVQPASVQPTTYKPASMQAMPAAPRKAKSNRWNR